MFSLPFPPNITKNRLTHISSAKLAWTGCTPLIYFLVEIVKKDLRKCGLNETMLTNGSRIQDIEKESCSQPHIIWDKSLVELGF